jgi:hypothetical protein
MTASLWPQIYGAPLRTRRPGSLAGCVLAIVLLLNGCGDSGSTSGEPDARPGGMDAGDMRDASDLDASPGGIDAGDMPDSGMPSGAGVEDCITACEAFSMTNCSTPAADFCESAQQNCQARYDDNPDCQAQLEAMDACAAAQPAANFTCPLGTVPDELRPYRLTEDVCVTEATALEECL